jgi:esterase/lipase superfamily enzyme
MSKGQNWTPTRKALDRIEHCRRSGIKEVDLSRLGLKQLPLEITEITGLEELLLYDNKLTSVPPEIGQLSSLTRLSFAQNRVQVIPAQIGNAVALEQLSLDDNLLTQLPGEVGLLGSLRELYLHSNRLKSLPVEIGQLIELSVLFLHDNQLRTLPKEIGGLKKLEALSLQRNALEELPAELQHLTRLEHLFLHDNPLLDIPDDVLGPTWKEVYKKRRRAARPKKILEYYFSKKPQVTKTLLILAANPKETDRLAIAEEVKAIKARLELTDLGRAFQVKVELAARVTELSKLLLQHNPTIVHFSGHGSPTGDIVLEDENNAAFPVNVQTLAKLFGILGGEVECVVLNACYAGTRAVALSQQVGCVVGMHKAIGDPSALRFSQSFYTGLAYGKDYKTAYELGCVDMDLLSLPDALVPRFTVRGQETIAQAGATPKLVNMVPAVSMRTWSAATAGPVLPRLFPVYYGTNREPVDPTDLSKGFTGEHGEFVYHGLCKVVIPKGHKFGSLGSSLLKRLLKWNDDRLKLQEVTALAEDAFWDSVRQTIAGLAVDDRTALVFIHGFDVTFSDAAIRAAQMGFDLKHPGVMAFFSWPSRGRLGLFDYTADEASIEASENQISEFLVSFAKRSSASRVHVIAHSMGNRGLLRAMQKIVAGAAAAAKKPFGHIIFAAPDVGTKVFRDLAKAHQALADKTTLYLSSRDRAVKSSAILHKGARAGFWPPVTVVDGIDSVDVTNADLSLLGHGYYGAAEAVLYDMHELLLHNAQPVNRVKVQPSDDGRYWVIE